MAAVVGSLRADLSANVAHFAGDMGKSAKVVESFATRFGQVAKRVQSIGTTMSLAVTAPLVLFGRNAVLAFADAEKQGKKVEAVLATMGQRAGFSADELRGMATAMEKALAIDADDILGKVTSNLLTFGNVQGEVFRRAQELAADLSTQLGTDLQSATIMLGKALNDPVKGITALTRVGVSFTAQQKAQVKALAESGRTMEAQNLILAELERQYGQVAEVAASTADGALRALNIQWENLQEEIGEIIVAFLPPLIDLLKEVADWVSQLSPQTKEWIVIVGGLAAALGPALLALGLFAGGLKNVAWVITAVLIPALAALLAHPIIAGAVIIGAGIGYLIDQFDDATDAANRFKGELDKIQSILNAIKNGSDFADPNWKMPTDLWGELNKMGVGEVVADSPTEAGLKPGSDKPREKIRTAKEVASAARDLARDIERVKDASKDAERAVSDFAGDGLAPLESRLREVDERYADLKADIQQSIAEARASVGANAEAAGAIKSLEQSLVALEAAHAKATAAAKAQYEAEQRIADLDMQRDLAEGQRSLQELRDAKSGTVLGAEGEAVKQAEQYLADLRLDGARRVAELEIARDQAQRENDTAQVERYNSMLALQREYNAEVDATTASQLVAAERLRDAWASFADQLSDQLSDMILDWKFDLDGIRDVFKDIAKQLFLKPFLESATSGIGNFFNGLLGLPGKAAGGHGFAGSTYWVGEEGPELFTPGRSGVVTPHDESMEAMGSRRGGVVVNQTINTPNADSFRKSKRQIASDAKRGMNFA